MTELVELTPGPEPQGDIVERDAKLDTQDQGPHVRINLQAKDTISELGECFQLSPFARSAPFHECGTPLIDTRRAEFCPSCIEIRGCPDCKDRKTWRPASFRRGRVICVPCFNRHEATRLLRTGRVSFKVLVELGFD